MTTMPTRMPPPDTDGFFVLRTEAAPGDGAAGPQVLQQIVFIPYDSGSPCPCGSNEPFGQCCQPFGSHRPFLRNPGGGYAQAVIYAERWSGMAYSDVRGRLMNRPELWCTEDTLFRCCWRYRPEGGRESFGTLVLTPDGLELEALSKPRYTLLRSLLAEALGALPEGVRQVKALVADSEHEEADAPGPASSAVPLLEEYTALRERLRQVNNLAFKELTREEIGEAAQRLRLLSPSGQIVLDDEDEASVLADFALYEVKRRGQPVMSCFLRKSPLAGPEGAAISQAVANGWVGLFRVERKTPEGLVMRDLLDSSRPDLLLADLGLIQSAAPGMAVVGRLLPAPRFAMFSGWGFPVRPEQVEQVQGALRQIVQSESRRACTSSIIRYCRDVLPRLSVSSRLL